MNEDKIMSTESFNELIDGFEIVGSLTEYGRKNIKYYVNKLQTEKEQLNSLVNSCQEEIRILKEQKRLILKNVKEWIRCSKCEQLEPYSIHERYWNCFEHILRNIFKEYDTEKLSDEDLIYNHYLEKENEEIIKELQQKEDNINKARDKIQEIAYGGNEDYYMEKIKSVLKILDNKG